MLKYVLFCIMLIERQILAMDPDPFFTIVKNNVGNPAEIIRELSKIRETSKLADEFVHNFGGEGFDHEEGFSARGKCSSTEEEQLAEAAFAIGNEMRRKGWNEIDNVENLKISRRFLEFAHTNKGGHGQVDNDLSPSFWKEQLDDMIRVRLHYRKALEAVKISSSDSDSGF